MCFFFASSHLVRNPLTVYLLASGANFAALGEPGKVTE